MWWIGDGLEVLTIGVVVGMLRSGGSIRGRSKIYLPNRPDSSGVHPAYCTLSTAALFPWVKQPGLRSRTC